MKEDKKDNKPKKEGDMKAKLMEPKLKAKKEVVEALRKLAMEMMAENAGEGDGVMARLDVARLEGSEPAEDKDNPATEEGLEMADCMDEEADDEAHEGLEALLKKYR